MPSRIEDDELLNLVMPRPETFEFAEERRLFYVAFTGQAAACSCLQIAGSLHDISANFPTLPATICDLNQSMAIPCINVQNAGLASWSKGMVAVTVGFWGAISIQNASTLHSCAEPFKAMRVHYAEGASNRARHFSVGADSQFRIDKLTCL